ncbi:hypothetical protein ACFFK0_27725 [Paenibacillus chartarius]|uniref:Uncharacterized protein n=1 Tax=Paenibacillus chartarius TaxID=747481 RepID=A0ABV6DU57_9BACL
MKHVQLPTLLHDVFGKEQRPAVILLIVLFGAIVAGALFFMFPATFEGIAVWRRVLAFLLIFDICSGSVANFTASTSNYYAERPHKRLVFIAVHVHLPLVALLLGIHSWTSIVVWLYTAAGAYVVNAQSGERQVFVSGLLLAAGIGWVPVLYAAEPVMLVAGLLFMLKVLFSFSVDHYRLARNNGGIASGAAVTNDDRQA